ncbi:MAG: NUDIX hydrolase [Acidobacteriota bacterium]|nr:NUDIX hydrolase [Acidobacteriota bacterium]
MQKPRNPFPTVDIIIEVMRNGRKTGIVLIKRKNPPYGWALPGGFVDTGESLEAAAAREALEETSLAVDLVRQFHTYSDPRRDPRFHTISTVYIARAEGRPVARDDAREAGVFTKTGLPPRLAFDHGRILDEYFAGKGRRPCATTRTIKTKNPPPTPESSSGKSARSGARRKRT